MTNSYHDWIKNNYPNKESARLQCGKATTKMVDTFPELRRVRGHIYTNGFQISHWWCETKDGEIIDPTAVQFDTEIALYEEASAEEPYGKCLNCGDLLFKSRGAGPYFCKECK